THPHSPAGIRQLDTAAARTVHDIVVDMVIAALCRYRIGRRRLRYRTLVRPGIVIVVVRARIPQIHPLVPDTDDHVVMDDHAVQHPGRIVHGLIAVIIREDADTGSDVVNIDVVDFYIFTLAENINPTLGLITQHRVVFQLETIILRRGARSGEVDVRTVFE